MRLTLLLLGLLLVGCDNTDDSPDAKGSKLDPNKQSDRETLREARQGFETKIVKQGPDAGPPDFPPEGVFQLIHYPSPVGDLAAYLTPDPGDQEKHPAIVWITGGDNNSIGDVWSPNDRDNDQSASAYRKAGIVMMFPSQRGGNTNPGQREGFLGEADDILAATDYLASLDYVDPDRIYLGGHSTGGTMVMLVGANSDRYRAVFAFGPVSKGDSYQGSYIYCDANDEEEVRLRSPLLWLDSVQTPMYVFEGVSRGNISALEWMADQNNNAKIRFFPVSGHDHFSVLAPVNEILARQIVDDKIDITKKTVQGLR